MVTTAPSPVTEWTQPRRRVRAPRIAWPRRRLALRRIVIVGDALVGMLAAFAVRPYDAPASLALAAVWVLLVAPGGAPGLTPAFNRVDTAAVVRSGLGLAFLGLVVGAWFDLTGDPGSLAAFAVVLVTATLVQRVVVTYVASHQSAGTVDVVVAGHRHGVERMLDELRTAGSRVRVVSVCLTGREGPAHLEVPAVRGLHNVASVVAEHGAAAVIAVPCRHVDPARLRRLGWQLERRGTPLFVGTGLREIGPARAHLGAAGSLPLIHVRHAPLRGVRRLVKQAWESAAAALVLLLLAPVLLVLCVLVRLDSPGPALFRQTRVGRDGRTFTMLKMRTMCVDAEDRRAELTSGIEPSGVLFKLRDDPRITRVGRFLRRYSLDELPQLINVVRGDMALVGPRPPLPDEVAQYDHDARRRLAVTPGLTGLWQVSGRSDLSWEESVRLDLRYVENWSVGLDLSILLRTAGAVLGHRGAY